MNRIVPLSAILGSFLLMLPLAAAARGELITFQFAGTVTSVTVRPAFGIENFDFPDVGDPFTGFYTFDSNANDGANQPDEGLFVTVLLNRALAASVGEFQFEGRSIDILTFQDYYEAADGIPGIEFTSNPALAQILDRNNFSLVVTKPNFFSDPNELPLTPPSLVGATRATLTMWMDSRFNLSDVPFVEIRASLDSLTVVPEPSGSVLFGLAMLPVSRFRNRRFQL